MDDPNDKNINLIFMFALLALFLTACKSVTVENPTSDTVYTDAPEIRLTFPKGRPDPFEATLNGSDITALLNVTEEGLGRLIFHDFYLVFEIYNEATAQALFNEFLPVVLPVIMNTVGVIPLPSFKGYG